MATMTLNLDEHCDAIVTEASEAMGISKSEFLRLAIKFAATANAVFVEHPQTTIGICGPMAFPALLKFEYYAWFPMWQPKADSIVIDASKAFKWGDK